MATTTIRERNLVIKISADELGMLKALANEDGAPMATLVRAWVRNAWRERHGDVKAPKPPARVKKPKLAKK